MKSTDIRIVFMGTPDFAVGPLKALVEEGIQIAGIVTAPDKPAGRGKKMKSPAVKEYASANLKCPVFQPEKLRDTDFVAKLESLGADMFIVVAFRMLPEVVWKIPPKGTINLHASLLPQYRGAAPINWCIINGETETGVTTFLIDEEIDTGRILLSEKVSIEATDNAGTLHDKLMETGSGLLVRTVFDQASGDIVPVEQEVVIPGDGELKKAPKIYKEDCKLNWKNSTTNLNNKIRGLSPFPSSFTYFIKPGTEPVLVKIFQCSLVKGPDLKEAGSIVSDNKSYMHIACSDGYLEIQTLQMAGKKRMGVENFLRGFQDDLNEYIAL